MIRLEFFIIEKILMLKEVLGKSSLMKLFCELIMRFVLVSLLLIMVTINIDTFTKSAYAQFTGDTQMWKDNERNVKILFNHSPQNPIINTPTQMRFTITDLRTDVAFKKVLVLVAIIGNSFSNGKERVIKFDGLSDEKGNYSVNYTFPDLGVYQVIMRTKSNDPKFATLASFYINVALDTKLSNTVIGLILISILASLSVLSIITKRILWPK
jgi:hypothetical protein